MATLPRYSTTMLSCDILKFQTRIEEDSGRTESVLCWFRRKEGGYRRVWSEAALLRQMTTALRVSAWTEAQHRAPHSGIGHRYVVV